MLYYKKSKIKIAFLQRVLYLKESYFSIKFNDLYRILLYKVYPVLCVCHTKIFIFHLLAIRLIIYWLRRKIEN